MRTRMLLPVAVFIAGLAAIAYSVATGHADVSLVVIFPVFSGSSGLFLLGMLLIVLSFFAAFAMIATSGSHVEIDSPADTAPRDQPARKTSYGGVVLIGPIPIAFGSDKRMALVMLVIGVALAIVLVVALFFLG